MMTVSCNLKEKVDYKYQNQFEEYLNKYHNINLKNKSIIIFAIPVNSCSPCVKLQLEKISIMENPKVIAIAWGDTEKDFIPYKTKTSGITILSLDVKGNYMWYDLGVFSPRVFNLHYSLEGFIKKYNVTKALKTNAFVTVKPRHLKITNLVFHCLA